MTKKVRAIITTILLSALLISMTGCSSEDDKPLSEEEKAMAINNNKEWYENNVIGADSYSYQLTIRDHDFNVTVLNNELMIKAENSNNNDEFYIKIEDEAVRFISFYDDESHLTYIDDPLLVEATTALLFPDNLDFIWDNAPTYVGIGQILGQNRKDLTTYYLTEYHLDSNHIYAPFTIYDGEFESNNRPIVFAFALYQDEGNQTDVPFTDKVYQILATNISQDILRVLSEIFAVTDYPFNPATPLEDEPDLMIVFNQDYNETETFLLPVID